MLRSFVVTCTIAALTPCFAQAPCAGTTTDGGRVTAVRDGRSLMLDIGREVKLAGIELPGESAGNTKLEDLTLNRRVRLKANGADDRYGRTVALVYVEGSETPVQFDLLTAGYGRVAGSGGDRACMAALLRHEAVARQAGLGIWTDSKFATRDAGKPDTLLAERGRFTLVEGKVVSVRELGPLIYVNFGRRYTRDFTVTILKRNERTFTAAGIEPTKLQGRRLRVRGYIEQRGGPVIEAARPEQIEFAELN